MTVSGSSGAVLNDSGMNPRITKDPKAIRLSGYTDMGEHKATLLNKKTYKWKTLQKYKELVFEGCENDMQ